MKRRQQGYISLEGLWMILSIAAAGILTIGICVGLAIAKYW